MDSQETWNWLCRQESDTAVGDKHAMTVKGFVILTLAFHKEGKNWVGECLELGTSTYGRIFRKAHDELIEMIALHLNELEATGERSRFFREHGIKLYTDDVPTEVHPAIQVDSETLIEVHRMPVGAAE